ncbi:MAG TPA: molecular chaperone DnaJ [Acidimicrobiia bacterium]|nr:molecular chaperone DnaJ [Acidimicrobiia bacterium]
MSTDFYELLGVDRSATDDEIKKAYRRLARQYHPDANPGDAEAEARFKEISVAYETLRDPERRRRYDMFGPDGAPSGANAAGFGGFGGLNDLFDAFFGGGDAFGRGAGGGGPARGADAETVLELTLEEVVRGARRTIDVRLPVTCDACDGSGCAPGTHPQSCETCGGSGEVRQVRRSLIGQIVTAGPCPQCGGLGAVIPDPCTECRGDGRVLGPRTLEVEVPAGIDDGQRLRLSGRGPAAPRGGPPGDLYVTVRVAPHPDLERHGGDLHRAVRVSMVQAALGTEVDVDTFDGPQSVAIAAGTQHGLQQRLRGLGVPSLRNGRRGDLVLHVVVEVPTQLSAEETALLVQLAELRGERVEPARDGLFSRIKSAFNP